MTGRPAGAAGAVTGPRPVGQPDGRGGATGGGAGSAPVPRPRFTLRLRFTLLFAGLLTVVAVTLLGTAAAVLDRALQAMPQFPPGQTLLLHDSSGTRVEIDSSDFAKLVRAQARTELLRSGGFAFAVIVVAGLAAGYLLAGQALQPVSRVTAAARRLSTETLDSRIALEGPDDELKELADTFDAMLARLDAAFDSQRRFVANASHELRTPLAVIRTEVDVTLADADATVAELRTMGEVVRDASVRADRLVDALLVLARSEAQARVGLELREPVDLAELLPAALAALDGEATERGVTIDAQADVALTEGDPHLLERLVGNLVENAVRHNLTGGWVTVRTGLVEPGAPAWDDPPTEPAGFVPAGFGPAGVGPDRSVPDRVRPDRGGPDRPAAGSEQAPTDSGPGSPAAAVQLAVVNSGPIVPAQTVDDLFEPFRRGGTARTGSRGAGLGLSIVRAVAAAHGGQVVARPLAGGGLLVVVRLPVLTV